MASNVQRVLQIVQTAPKKGFLKRRGGFFGTYNRFWVVLENQTLSLFSFPSDLSPAFIIPLEGAAVVIADHLIGKRHSFAIFPSASAQQINAYPGAPVHLVAESDAERDDWMKSISDSAQSSSQTAIHTIEAIIDSVVVTDAKGEIVAFNRASEQLFGWTASEIIGRSVNTLLPRSVAQFHDHYMESYSRTKKATVIGKSRKVVAVRKDGSDIPVDISLGEMPSNAQGAQFIAVFREREPDDEEDRYSNISANIIGSTTIVEKSKKVTVASHRRAVDHILQQHEMNSVQLWHKIHQETLMAASIDRDLSLMSRLSDSTDPLDDLDGDEEVDLIPTCTDDDIFEQIEAMEEHKRQIDKITLVTRNLDRIIESLLEDARSSAMNQFTVFLDSRFGELNQLQLLSNEAKQKISEMEENDRVVRNQLKTRTEGMLQLQRKLTAMSRMQGVVAPKLVITDTVIKEEPPQPRPPPICAISLTQPNPPIPPSPSSQVQLLPPSPVQIDSPKGCPIMVSPPPPSEPTPPTTPKPQPQPPKGPHPSVSSPRHQPITVSTVHLDNEIHAHHNEMTRLWNNPFLQQKLERGKWTCPETKGSPASALLAFDTSFIREVNKIMESEEFVEMTQHNPKACKKEANEIKKKNEQLTKKVGALVKKQTDIASPSSSSSAADSAAAILSQIAAAERAFHKARAVANFHVVTQKVKLQEIQEAITANQSGMRSQDIQDMLQRMAERRKVSLEKWEKKKSEIIAQREQALSKALVHTTMDAASSPASLPSLVVSSSKPTKQQPIIVQRRQSVCVPLAIPNFGQLKSEFEFGGCSMGEVITPGRTKSFASGRRRSVVVANLDQQQPRSPRNSSQQQPPISAFVLNSPPSAVRDPRRASVSFNMENLSSPTLSQERRQSIVLSSGSVLTSPRPPSAYRSATSPRKDGGPH